MYLEVIFLDVIFALFLCFVLFLTPLAHASEGESDAQKFKHEYEILNDNISWDGVTAFQPLTIPEDSEIQYATEKDLELLLETGTGVLYLGFPECPWCRTLIPPLLQAQIDSAYTGKLYCYNALYDRDVLSLADDGTITVENEGSETYNYLLSKLAPYLPTYEGLNDNTIKRIYFPTTVFIKNGTIISVHLNTIEEQEEGSGGLTEEQHNKLYNILLANFNDIVQN